MSVPARSPWFLRGLVLVAYAVNGFCLSAWSVRLPAVGDATGLGADGLGVFLTAGAVGTVATVPLVGRWVARTGPGRVYLLATAGFAVAYTALAVSVHVGSGTALVAANVVHGAAFAATNVPQSLLGARAERRVGRTVLPQFHAVYSLSAAVGAAAGGAAAGAGVQPGAQFAALAVLAVLVRGAVSVLLRRDPDAGPPPARGTGRAAPRTGVWLEPQVLLLGVVVFATALSEGAANNWVTPTLVGSFPVTEGTAATAVSLFLCAQTLGRLAGGRVVDRVGPRAALVGSGLVSAAGVAAFGTAPALWVCWVGAAAWGLGAALSVPVAISLVAGSPDAPQRIAAVTSLSSLANVVGPPLIGAAAGVVGLRWAVGSIAVVLLGGVLAARAAARPGTTARRAGPGATVPTGTVPTGTVPTGTVPTGTVPRQVARRGRTSSRVVPADGGDSGPGTGRGRESAG
ncbi:MFS transporter [Paenibacillus sp. TRM 82003]|uniref:MFS transporter n=1 Tax=Kineococcus sp. TRM81007 TaxID=2925831 RepID=UPI001F56A906|nr:MFS transporter [Kineococcus sp. TRM81007]MCI2236922.1 MFS transporter [Kineococcus sp. TRM81007]MCI3921914.1 MFS transporter [Paenibacillus sp. TRM 82003]